MGPFAFRLPFCFRTVPWSSEPAAANGSDEATSGRSRPPEAEGPALEGPGSCQPEWPDDLVSAGGRGLRSRACASASGTRRERGAGQPGPHWPLPGGFCSGPATRSLRAGQWHGPGRDGPHCGRRLRLESPPGSRQRPTGTGHYHTTHQAASAPLGSMYSRRAYVCHFQECIGPSSGD